MKIIAKATLKGAFTGACLGMIPVLHVSHAQQVVDPAAAAANQSGSAKSLNGTAVQNIAAPNASGLSHNKFSSFNVDAKGLVINNSRINAISNIGGAVVANPNLAGGEARLILNEVTGGSRSMLNGMQELLGGRAGYILANPNGITCDGCGFINFPRATLTTGRPSVLDGTIHGFSVNGGDVLVGPNGLNATGADYFDIITRATVFQGRVNANDLSLVLGRNQVNYASLAATPLPDAATEPAPSFSLDSAELGGMYAGRIFLRSTEAGVGVRALGAIAASVSDVSLDVNGKLTFNGNAVSAARDVALKATQAELNGATVYAGNDASLQAADVALAGGRTGAARDLRIQATTLNDSGSGQRDAGRDLTVQATGTASVTGSTWLAGRNLTAEANALALRAGARLMGEADAANADGSGLGQTRVTVTNALTLEDAALFGGHTVDVSAASVTVDAASNDGGAQGIRGAAAVSVNAGVVDNAGLIASDAALAVNATTVDNRSGGLLQGASTSLAATTLTNAGDIGSTGAMDLRADTLTNRTGGQVLANGTMTLQGNGGATTGLVNESGAAIKAGALSASFGSATNTGQLYGQSSLAVTATTLTNNAGGTLTTPGTMTLQQAAAGGTLRNTGTVEAGALTAAFTNLQNDAGAKIFGDAAATFTVANASNAGELLSDGSLAFNTDGARGTSLTNTGTIDGGTLGTWFGTVTNDGTLFGETSLVAGAGTLTNRKAIGSGGSMDLAVRDLFNTSTATDAADIYAIGNLTIRDNHTLANTSATGKIAGIVSRDGSLAIDSRSGDETTQSVTNSGGLLFGGQDLTALVSRQFVNQAWVGMRAYTFANLGNLLLGAPDSTTLVARAQPVTVRNVDSDIEARQGNIDVFASYFQNTTTDSAPVKQEVYLGTRTAGDFDYDGTLNGAGDLVQVYSNCGTFADHFDETRQGHRCTQGVNMYEERFTAGADNLAPRARLIAGNHMNLFIENQALNYISLMSAGGNITIGGAAGATFENRAETLRYRETAYVVRYDDGGVTHNPAGDCDDNACFFGWAEDPAPNDALSHKKRFTNISLANDPFRYTQGIKSTVQAAGNITINIGELVNNSTGEKIVASAIPSAPPAPPAVGNPTGPGTVGTQGLGTPTLSGISTLITSPFFVPAKSPTSPFLYETDPRLMSLAGLHGSSLLLDALGLDPTKYMRVGDPYFEQQLLRQQLLALAGQIYIADGLASENEQYKLLLTNAIAAGQDLKLRVGVALTSEQVANLHKDIVWMVESVVNGKKVLVPQLYLSDASKAKLADGARFVASSISVKTEGAVTSSGAFVATKDISIDAGTTFTNRMGTLVAANGLSIAATGDILNQSGTIRGGNVALESRTGSVVNETLVRDEVVHGVHGQGASTVVGQTATIESTGNLSIKAAQDIVSKGGQVTAGQDATLEAGRDITFTAIERKSLESSVTNTQADGYSTTQRSSTQRTEVTGSGLTVGGNLDAKAARDINVEASTIDVAGGGRLDAGRTINITALAETSTKQDDSTTTSWNTKNRESTTVTRTTGEASSVNFGGSLAISSGGDTNIKGSQIAVGGDLNVEKIGGNLNVTTFQETTTVHSESKSSSFFGGEAKADAGKNITQSTASARGTLYSSSEETTDISSTTHLRSGISVGGNLNAGPGAIKGDVNITGSQIATGGDLNLAAGGNINVLAAEDTTTVTKSSKSTSLYVGADASIDGAGAKLGVDHKETNGSATETKAQVSGLSSGGNMTINAGGDFTEQGTQVRAGGDIKVEADSIKSLAAKDSYTETGDSLSVSVSIGVKAETGLGSVVGSFINDKSNKADFDMAAASQSLNGLSVPDAGSVKAELSVSTTKSSFSNSGNEAKTSSFSAGGNVSFTAREGDATFAGTQVEAGKSIDVTATKGSVNILAAESSTSASKTTTQADVTVGVSMDGTISGSGSGSKDTESSSSTKQTAASFKAGSDLNIAAKNDVTLVGTNLEAGGTAAITATDGKIDFKAARDTTSATTSNENANASFSANISGKEGSVGGGGGKLDTTENSSTGTAGSIKAGNVVLKSKGDITLEGTNIAAKDSATIETQGKVDFKAVEDTYSRTAKGSSGQVELEAGAKGGGATAGGSTTNESEQRTTRTGGSLTASNLTIKAGDGVRLEGTQVDVSKDASIDAGKGKLVLESAVSTYTKTVDNSSGEGGIKGDAKTGAGQGSLKVQVDKENTEKVTNQNASIKVGGKADLQAAGGIDVKGSNVTGVDSVVKAGTLDTHGATVNVEQRQDVDKSTKTNVGVSVGVIVPSKKARKEVTDTFNKAKDSKAGTALKNSVENTKAQLGLQTKDQATENKRANNVAYADRKASEADARITADQGKKDQKAAYDQQKADDRATADRDKALKAIDPTADPKAQEAQKAKIQSEFEAKKQANAETAEKTKQDNAVAALDARSEYAEKKTLVRKDAAEDKAADSQKRHAVDAEKVQVALAVKGSDEAKQVQAKETQVQRKGDVEADQLARKTEQKADSEKVKADSAAKKERVQEDIKAQQAAKTDVQQARDEQKRLDDAVDADSSLSAKEKADKKALNADKAAAEIKAANEKLAATKEDNARKEAEKLEGNQTAREKAKAEADLKKEEKLADAERERALVKPKQELESAQAKADKAKTDALAALEKKRNEDTTALDKKRDEAVAAAAKKRDEALAAIDKDATMKPADKQDARKKAEKAFTDAETAAKDDHAKAKTPIDKVHSDGVKAANDAHKDDQGVKDARKNLDDTQDAAKKQHDAKVEQARKDAETKEKLADLDATRRKALAEKAAAKEKADAQVKGDDSLSGVEKANRLHDNAKTLADESEKAAAEQARKEEAQKATHDDEARKAEEAAIDPKLTTAEKDKRKKEIADKYADLKTQREADRDAKLKAAEDAKKTALADAKVEHTHREEQAKADAAAKTTIDALDTKLAKDVKEAEQKAARDIAAIDPSKPADEKKRLQEAIEKKTAERKNDLQAKRDTEAAKAAADRDIARAQADQTRVKEDADLAKQRETAALAKETTLTPEERTRRQGEIDKRHTDATTMADQKLAAQKSDIEGRSEEEAAAAKRKQRDADIDADTALTAKEREQAKKKSEADFLAEQKTAQGKRDKAQAELAKLMTPEEKAAADALAAKAKDGGARVKNPYALTTRAKHHAVKAKRWKEVVTSFGLDVDKTPPPVEEKEEKETTLASLLPLAKQFQAGDQALALRALEDPAVQNAAAMAAAVDALREEAREEMARAYALAETGKELGVLTVADQRRVLAKEGIELPEGLPSAEVTKRFNAYLDAAAASVQPTTEQKAEILKSLGIELGKKTADEVYAETVLKGKNQAEKVLTQGGVAPGRAKEVGGMLGR